MEWLPKILFKLSTWLYSPFLLFIDTLAPLILPTQRVVCYPICNAFPKTTLDNWRRRTLRLDEFSECPTAKAAYVIG